MTAQLPVTPPIPQIYSVAYIVAYAFLVMGVVEQFRSRGVISDLLSRNVVGLAVVPCTLAAPWLFTDWYWAIAVPGLFLILTVVSMRFGLLPSVDAERGRFGGVAMAIVLCASAFIGWFFTDPVSGPDLRPLAAFCLIPSTVADSLAAIVGARHGRGELRHKRSKMGVAAGIAGGIVAFVIVNLVFGFTGWVPYLLGVGFGVATGFAELVSPVQLDNLTTGVVAGVGGYLILLLGQGG
jgi:dolichol kinase